MLTSCPPATGGPALVPVPGGYCVDSTEVTRSQYEAWLAGNPMTDGQDPSCSWNDTYVPDSVCMKDPHVCKTSCANHPQECVDWCDAAAFCRSAGKRLCGRIGGGSVPFDDHSHSEANVDQWFNACSSGGVNIFPYGNGYQMQTCNGNDHTQTGCAFPQYECTTQPVGALGGCQSLVVGYASVYDMSGNVAEWEDSCKWFGGTDNCIIRGGGVRSDPDLLRCALGSRFVSKQYWLPRNKAHATVGFRCCSG
jgi:formylglycine-generating enzyme required for sulfatase activity